MRRAELVNLKVHDVDMERGTVIIRGGKGKKDRMIPIGDRAIAWIEKYFYEVRPTLALEPDAGFLFLTKDGEPFNLDSLTQSIMRRSRTRTSSTGLFCIRSRKTLRYYILCQESTK